MSDIQTMFAGLLAMSMATVLSVAAPPRTVLRSDLAEEQVFDCRLERTAGMAGKVVLTNTGMRAIPGGAGYVWSTLGTPAPVGELRQLPQGLNPKEAVAVALPFEVYGAGCVASLQRATPGARFTSAVPLHAHAGAHADTDTDTASDTANAFTSTTAAAARDESRP